MVNERTRLHASRILLQPVCAMWRRGHVMLGRCTYARRPSYRAKGGPARRRRLGSVERSVCHVYFHWTQLHMGSTATVHATEKQNMWGFILTTLVVSCTVTTSPCGEGGGEW
eukprot:gene12242-biopygen1899